MAAVARVDVDHDQLRAGAGNDPDPGPRPVPPPVPDLADANGRRSCPVFDQRVLSGMGAAGPGPAPAGPADHPGNGQDRPAQLGVSWGFSSRMSEEHFVNVLNANLVSAYRLAKLAIRPMMKARHGRIILISSAGALAGVPGQTNYAAAKSGLVGFGRSLAKEVASRGITVNIIAPGWTDTDMVSHLTDDQRTAAISEVPLGRFAHPTEIADAALYLADAAYVTGVVLPIDGGAAMGI